LGETTRQLKEIKQMAGRLIVSKRSVDTIKQAQGKKVNISLF
jgi:hypothetical protein